MRSFDLVVLGTGIAGYAVASACRAAGWRVAIVDSRPFGGTCALRGCDPKRVLGAAAEAVEGVRRLSGKGVRGRGVAIDWPALARWKRTFTDPVPRRTAADLRKAGIAAFRGQGRFAGPRSIRVGRHVLQARHIVLATGAIPAPLGFPGEEHLVSSEDFLALRRMPRRLVFVGSGFVSFEFAHVAVVAGARVTMIERGARPLSAFDPDLVAILVERTRAMGIEVHLRTKVEAVRPGGDGFVVRASSGKKSRAFPGDLVVHGAGRVAELDELDLERGEVERDEGGVRVNAFLQSVSNPFVHAAGDAASGGPMLTPVASYEAETLAANLLHRKRRRVRYDVVPSAVFTIPPLAGVGLQEAQAKERGLRFRKIFQRTGDWYSSHRLGEATSAHKVLVEEATDRILGAHLLGPNADELVNLFALAMRARVRARDLREALFAYPTVGSDVPSMV